MEPRFSLVLACESDSINVPFSRVPMLRQSQRPVLRVMDLAIVNRSRRARSKEPAQIMITSLAELSSLVLFGISPVQARSITSAVYPERRKAK
jgi:hypothetical protein